MTRINVIPVEELTDKHLTGENHEITRVFGLVRKAIARKVNKYNFTEKVNPPAEYTLGTGHVKFFYRRLGYITKRYYQLQQEMIKRGYRVNTLGRDILTSGINDWWFDDYTPTPEALEINRRRIQERLQ